MLIRDSDGRYSVSVDDDSAIPDPDISIRKPWRQMSQERRFWPDVLIHRRAAPRLEMCGHCGQHPRALAPWSPDHPIYHYLCSACRASFYNWSFTVAVRRELPQPRILDALMYVCGFPPEPPLRH